MWTLRKIISGRNNQRQRFLQAGRIETGKGVSQNVSLMSVMDRDAGIDWSVAKARRNTAESAGR